MTKDIGNLSKPLTAQFEITNGCNHRCIHCYLLPSDEDKVPVIEVSDEVVLSSAKKLVESEIFTVVITGGEPLMKKELLFKVISLFTDNNIRVSLNSNLTLLDDEIASFLKEKEVNILTSCPSGYLDNYNKLTNTHNFRRFEKNLKKLSDLGVRFTVNMVVTKDNINDIIGTANILNKLGCKSFAATPMSLNMDYPLPNLSLSIKEVQKVVSDLLYIEKHLGMRIDIVESLPKCCLPKNVLEGGYSFLKRRCQAGRISISVSPNGDIRPCGHNSNSYGNINVSNIEEIYNNLHDWRSGEYIPKECYDCAWINFCNGGCRTNAYAVSGRWNERDIWMTNPIYGTMPFQKKEDIQIHKCRLKVNPNYRTRKEINGIYLVYNFTNREHFLVNEEMLRFIEDLCQNFKEVSYDDLVLYYDAQNNMDFEKVIKTLFFKGLLTIIEN